MKFVKGNQYTRNEVYKIYHPGAGDKPKGGPWDTGYTSVGDELIAFLNIDAAGRTGHDFDNSYNSETEILTWFGKPNSHSEQPTFKRLLDGTINPMFFARWDNKNTNFTFLGSGIIRSYKDGIPISKGKSTIRLEISLFRPADTIGAEGVVDANAQSIPVYAKRITMLTNRYERDPAKRQKRIEHFGDKCQICDFKFIDLYGDLGDGFCHIHHIEPLGEVGGELDINPVVDLIPVCPNCHAMLHRRSPALKPDELRLILSR